MKALKEHIGAILTGVIIGIFLLVIAWFMSGRFDDVETEIRGIREILIEHVADNSRHYTGEASKPLAYTEK